MPCGQTVNCVSRPEPRSQKLSFNFSLLFGDKFGESLVGSQAPPSFWEVPGLPRKFPELPQKFSATSPEVLLTAIQRFPGSCPNFPGSSPKTSSEVKPWEAWHPLLTRKNFLWSFFARFQQSKPSSDLTTENTGLRLQHLNSQKQFLTDLVLNVYPQDRKLSNWFSEAPPP